MTLHIIKKNGKFFRLMIIIFALFLIQFVYAGTVKITSPTIQPSFNIAVNSSCNLNDSIYWNGHSFVYGAVSSIETDPKAYNGTLAYNSSLNNYYPISNPYNFINTTSDTWSTNYSLYYTKIEIDTNFSLFYLASIINQILSGNITDAKTYSNNILSGNLTNYYNKSQVDYNFSLISSSDSWKGNFTFYYNKTQIDNNLSLYYLNSNPSNFSNITYTSDEIWINKNSSNSFNFNISKLSTTYYNATQSEAVAGTIDGGTLVDTQHQDGKYDGITFNFSEVSATPGLDLRINFTGIDSFNQGVMRYKTASGLSGAYPIIQMWNYDTGAWEDYPPVAEILTFVTIEQPVFDSAEHLSNGVAQMRIYKATKGNTGNKYYVDWIAISKGFGTPSGEEVDPYSFHKNENLNNSGYNISADYFIGDGSLLTGISTGNISNTSYYWVTSNNGTINGINTTWLDNVVGFLSFKLTQLETWFTGKLIDINNNINNNLTSANIYTNTNIAGNLSLTVLANGSRTMTGNLNFSNSNITNPTYIIMNEKSGACDLTINHSWCSNISGSYFVG